MSEVSPDPCEAIYVRLEAIAKSIEGITTAARNVDEIAESDRPALIVLDGDEAVANEAAPGVSSDAPELVTMLPELRLLLGDTPKNVGTALNAFRRKIYKAVKTDAELRTIVGRNGRIRYHGADRALGNGRTMEAEMLIRFAITYVMHPSKL